ncbi:hypothetical protein Q5692_04890 [Microcoleus sp. C2C3]|uniref:hypothetical protein n=1 Tax=unclassified Microcoleus TaxID=2642155 RepID=UPI002FD6B8A7
MKRVYQFILVIETLSLTGDITYYIYLSNKFRDFLKPLQKFIFADRERCAACSIYDRDRPIPPLSNYTY